LPDSAEICLLAWVRVAYLDIKAENDWQDGTLTWLILLFLVHLVMHVLFRSSYGNNTGMKDD